MLSWLKCWSRKFVSTKPWRNLRSNSFRPRLPGAAATNARQRKYSTFTGTHWHEKSLSTKSKVTDKSARQLAPSYSRLCFHLPTASMRHRCRATARLGSFSKQVRNSNWIFPGMRFQSGSLVSTTDKKACMSDSNSDIQSLPARHSRSPNRYSGNCQRQLTELCVPLLPGIPTGRAVFQLPVGNQQA
jgi:hypothetical protein